jgi:hypothetical protein
VASDNFNRSDESPPSGWTQDTSFTDTISLVSNQVENASAGVNGLIYYSASTVSSSQAVMTGTSSTFGANCLAIHCDGAGDGYLFFLDGALHRTDNGSISGSLDTTGTAAVTGDVCRIYRDGNDVVCTINGAEVMRATDTTYTSGHPGILMRLGAPDSGMDDWTDAGSADENFTLDTAGAVTVAGQTVNISGLNDVNATLDTAGAVTVAGQTVGQGVSVTLTNGTVAVEGQASLDATIEIQIDEGGVSVQGQTLDIDLGDGSISITIDVEGNVVVAGEDVDFSISGGSVSLDSGSIGFAGQELLTTYNYPLSSGALTVAGQSLTMSIEVTIGGGAITVRGQTLTAEGQTSLAILFRGPYKNVAIISDSGKTKWIDYLPVAYVTVTEDKVGTWDADGALAVRTIAASGTPWLDYTPIVEVATSGRDGATDDTGHLRITEVVDE